MKTFLMMISFRHEAITKKRSKDIRGTSACFKQKLRENFTYYIF